MLQENVESIHRGIDAFNRRDLDGFLALCDPDVEFYSRLIEVEGGGPLRGHDGVRTWWENLLSVWRHVHGEVVEVRDLGDLTVTYLAFAAVAWTATRPGSKSNGTSLSGATRMTLRMRTFLSEAEALEAAGLRE
jgi:ketosteroid isomerase-like protein